MEQRARVRELVLQMEQEMRRLEIWSSAAPSAEAMASEFPFCYDTLQFDEWLQWVFVPRITSVLEGNGTLPADSDISSLAEVWFIEQEMEAEAHHLVGLIRQFDLAIRGGG